MTGKKLIRIVEVLDEIKDWKKLAMQLDMKQGVINKIGGWDDVVRVLCDLKGDVPVEDVVATIAEALREIGNVKQADKLEQEFPGGTVITSGAFYYYSMHYFLICRFYFTTSALYRKFYPNQETTCST